MLRSCLFLCALVGLVCVAGCGSSDSSSSAETFKKGEACWVLPPKGYDAKRSYPLLFCLHPQGDAKAYLRHLSALAEDGTWIIAASTAFRNDTPHTSFLPGVVKALDDLELNYSVREGATYLAGFSGGGQASFVCAYFKAGRFAGVISNSGALHQNLHSPRELRLTQLTSAIFLAGKKDGVVPLNLLEEHKGIAEAAGIRVRLTAYDGGHALAPVETYREALAWLLEG